MKPFLNAFIKNCWPSITRHPLILLLSLLNFIVIIFFVIHLVNSQHDYLEKQQKDQSAVLAEKIAASAGAYLSARDTAGMQRMIAVCSNIPSLRSCMIVSANGIVIAHTDSTRLSTSVQDSNMFSFNSSTRVIHTEDSFTAYSLPVTTRNKAVAARAGIRIAKTYIPNGMPGVYKADILFILLIIVSGAIAYCIDKTAGDKLRNREAICRQQLFILNGINESLQSPVFSVDQSYRYTSFNTAHAAAMKAPL